jgi:hypothetical protein
MTASAVMINRPGIVITLGGLIAPKTQQIGEGLHGATQEKNSR